MMMMVVWVAVMEWREWSRGDGDGVGWHSSGVVVVTVGWRWWRVAESEYGDRVDPVVRTTFGFDRKNPPEKFSGGGSAVVAEIRRRWWRRGGGRIMGEGEKVGCTFTLNDHFATTLFDSGVDYSFVSTTFIPLLGLEPSNLSFRYEIEIASGQLVEIDKVIKGCKLEIEGHVFDIDLITFGHGSFDVIIGMDWLSNYKAEIIFHEKVVRIPLPDGKVLRVVGVRPEEKARLLMSAKASDKNKKRLLW
ncbi:putative reverse transcriptase domain-containing protein, partial [Tanacetum coccineum]